MKLPANVVGIDGIFKLLFSWIVYSRRSNLEDHTEEMTEQAQPQFVTGLKIITKNGATVTIHGN